ncbi:MAG: glutaminase [Elainellaceae cyanobacterium]
MPQLTEWMRYARHYAESGHIPTYVGGLASAQPDWFGLKIGVKGQGQSAGETHLTFPFMSVMKPFLLFYLLETEGERVFEHVGIRPSQQPFNSLKQLEEDGYFPRNPMLNSGALALTAMLPGATGQERCDRLRQWLNRRAGCRLTLDETMLATVRALPNEQNRRIARRLGEAGHLESNAAIALDAYEQMCCLSGTLDDVVALGQLLNDPQLGVAEHQRKVLALMLTCGLYEESGEAAVRIGLPIKSGVSGILLAVLPAGGVIASYSPPLNAIGNSIGGLYVLTQLSQHLKLSVLSPKS